MEGTVKWFNGRKGYGFIKGDDGKEYFVHYTAVPQGVFLKEESRVSFDPAEGKEGKPQAQNIVLLEGEGASEESEEENTDEETEEKKAA